MLSAEAHSAAPAVALTHEAEHEDTLYVELRRMGVRIERWPSVRTGPPPDVGALSSAVADLHSFDWIVFTSRRAVDAVRALRPSLPRGLRVACVGPRAARAADAAGWVLSFVGTEGASALGLALSERLESSDRVVFPAAVQASGALEGALGPHCASFLRVAAYDTQPVQLDGAACRNALEDGGVAAVTFLSPSAVESTLAALTEAGGAEALRGLPAACIGPSTAACARRRGFISVFESREASKEAVVLLLTDMLAKSLPV